MDSSVADVSLRQTTRYTLCLRRSVMRLIGEKDMNPTDAHILGLPKVRAPLG